MPELYFEPEDSAEERLRSIEPAATALLVAVWQAIRRGDIPDRGAIDDAALRLRDALNPDGLANPNWLPDELRDEDPS